MDETTRNKIAPVLGQVPSGIFILTVSDGGSHQTGMLASWVQQASFEPPSILVAVNKSRYVNEWITSTKKAAVSLVGESQKQFLAHFGRGFEPDQPAFEGISTVETASGLPALADAIGYLTGDIVNQLETGDHIVYLLEVTDAGTCAAHDAEKPMVHLRKNGFHY